MGSRPGIFVTLEGGEGSGKTTQRRRIVAYLESMGRTVRQTREPGGTEAGELIRDILLHRVDALTPRAELALYLASRSQHVEELVRPSLELGIDVICDRFHDSSTAYQGGGRDLGIDLVEKLNDWAIDGTGPDVTFWFDLPAETGLKRRQGRSGGVEALDRIERESLAFHERVREAYREIAARHPERVRVITIEGGEDEVWEQVRRALDEVLAAAGARSR